MFKARPNVEDVPMERGWQGKGDYCSIEQGDKKSSARIFRGNL
jgi:hypothetical protein